MRFFLYVPYNPQFSTNLFQTCTKLGWLSDDHSKCSLGHDFECSARNPFPVKYLSIGTILCGCSRSVAYHFGISQQAARLNPACRLSQQTASMNLPMEPYTPFTSKQDLQDSTYASHLEAVRSLTKASFSETANRIVAP